MPIREVTIKGGRKGYRWGAHGKIYPTREQAEKQGAAAFSNGYTGDDAWVTAKPNGEQGKGAHILLASNGEIKAGMGGKFNGKNIKEVGKTSSEAVSPNKKGSEAPKIHPETNGTKLNRPNFKLGERQSAAYRGWEIALNTPPKESWEAKQNAEVRALFKDAETNPEARQLMKKLLSGNLSSIREIGKRYAHVKPDNLAKDSFLAFDEASRRRIDENGYLHVSQTHLTKEQVAPYYGREIPGYIEQGLDPDQVYYGYRSAEELEKSKDMFNGMPLLIIHKQDSAHTPLKEERVGSIGTTPVWDSPYLDNALIVTDQSAIEAIDSEKLKEISCGYFFDPDFTPGEFNGVAYDFVMRNIRGNHVALVKEGRAGPDVYVHDAMPSKPIKVQKIMQLTRKQVAVRATLAAYLKPRLTMDAAPADLTKLVGSYKKPSTLAKAVVRQYGNKIAQDMEIEPEELAELMEAAEEVVEPEEKKPVETEETIFDEDNVSESLKEILEGKVPDEVLAKILACVVEPVVGDELTEEEKVAKEKADKDAADAEAARKKKEGEPAMDANTIKLQARTEAQAHFRNLNEAGRKVRDLVGEVDVMAFDSAEDIYGHALKAKGVKIGQYEKSAYKGMVDMLAANKPSQQPITLDSSLDTFEGQFAGLGNIKIN